MREDNSATRTAALTVSFTLFEELSDGQNWCEQVYTMNMLTKVTNNQSRTHKGNSHSLFQVVMQAKTKGYVRGSVTHGKL